ncbi:hypothetical protein PMNALOAF_1246 [Methylobacterium adhaesivum]|uniref:3TM-type holin n=1 Tax=Methylobacterium adhaesivum TaxID=333297 RepID=A0ABT8BFJ8_9HYPH|nr:3TM-type holin [Methylobacterium adhaesivum]MDN3590609.1 3TM-type holin [Methylobacterium adhaesivum]GJD30003.1 hypothetical protein PMNALOAF_1246 [Methylobacterium adhaesivum]
MAGGILGGIIGAVLPGVLPSITDTAKILVDRLVPDPAARAQAQKELEEVISAREAAVMQAISEQNAAQNAVNLAEAQGNDRFSSRWRPAAAWVCVAGFAYQFVFAPIMTWAAAIIGTAAGIAFPVPPTLSTGDLMPVLLGLLGLGAQRSYERVNGVPGAIPGGPQTPGRR